MFIVMREPHPRTSATSSDPAERLFAARVDGAEFPAELTAVAALFDDAASVVERDPSPTLLTLMATTARASFEAPTPQSTRKHPMLAKILTAKVAAAAVLALTATGAAAATGSLPEAAQDGIANAASHVGINLPDSASDRAREATEDLGPSGDNHGTDVSGVATETDATGADKGAEISTTARDGHGQSGGSSADHGTEHGSARVETPNPGGMGTASDASGGANSTGESNADDAAVAGSVNAEDQPSTD